jgi:hypothetical protein
MTGWVMLVDSAAHRIGLCCWLTSTTSVIALLLGVALDNFEDLGGQAVVHILDLLLDSRSAHLRRSAAAAWSCRRCSWCGCALCCAQLVALILQLLLQGFNFVVERLELGPLGLKLLLHIAEVALTFVGLGHSDLEGDDGYFGWDGSDGRGRAAGPVFGQRRSAQGLTPAE